MRVDTVANMEIIKQVAPRIHSLHLSVDTINSVMLCQWLEHIDFPQLSYFGMTAHRIAVRVGPLPRSVRGQTMGLFRSNTPALHRLRITSPTLAGLPMDRLTTLIVHRSFESDYFVFAQFRDMITASPLLSRLLLENTIINQVSQEERTPIVLLGLKELQLEMDSTDTATGHEAFLLELLDTPNIHTLTLLKAMRPRAMRSLTRCVATKATTTPMAVAYPQLETLTLLGREWVDGCIAELAEAFPTITRLKLTTMNSSRVLRQLVSPLTIAGGMPWLHLRSLSLDFFSDSAMRDVVEQRAVLGLPLRELRAHGSTVRRSKNDIGWYAKQRVEVVHIDTDAEEDARTYPYREEEFESERQKRHIDA